MADLTQRETWCFQRTKLKNGAGKDALAPCPFKFIEYDGDPARYLSPINHSPLITLDHVPVNPVLDGVVMVGIEIFDSLTVPFNECHEFHFV